MRLKLFPVLALCIISACTPQVHRMPPQLPVLGSDGKVHCANADDYTCNDAAYHENMRLTQQAYAAKMHELDLASARKRLVTAKNAYKANPTTENEVAVEEAQAALAGLVSRGD